MAWSVGLVVLGSIAFVGAANSQVLASARSKVVADLASVPKNRVAIVLGTSPKFAGLPNMFFVGRIDAAARLYKAGKVERLLVSGDNGSRYYDEPSAMAAALIAKGVPKEHIVRDCAGFRTLDTMVRAKKVFGVDQATIVTDDFHMARTLYYAQDAGIQCVGYPSTVSANRAKERLGVRELLARARAVIDVKLLHTGPKFLGSPETIR